MRNDTHFVTCIFLGPCSRPKTCILLGKMHVFSLNWGTRKMHVTNLGPGKTCIFPRKMHVFCNFYIFGLAERVKFQKTYILRRKVHVFGLQQGPRKMHVTNACQTESQKKVCVTTPGPKNCATHHLSITRSLPSCE